MCLWWDCVWAILYAFCLQFVDVSECDPFSSELCIGSFKLNATFLTLIVCKSWASNDAIFDSSCDDVLSLKSTISGNGLRNFRLLFEPAGVYILWILFTKYFFFDSISFFGIIQHIPHAFVKCLFIFIKIFTYSSLFLLSLISHLMVVFFIFATSRRLKPEHRRKLMLASTAWMSKDRLGKV